jgi:hypothetical protein
MSSEKPRASVKFSDGEASEQKLGRTNSSPAVYAMDRYVESVRKQEKLRWSSCERAESSSATASATLVVLDFDCTLSSTHMHTQLQDPQGQAACQRNPGAFYDEIFGGSKRLAMLRSFLTQMRAAGATLYLLSSGLESDIDPALQWAELHELFDRLNPARVPAHHLCPSFPMIDLALSFLHAPFVSNVLPRTRERIISLMLAFRLCSQP